MTNYIKMNPDSKVVFSDNEELVVESTVKGRNILYNLTDNSVTDLPFKGGIFSASFSNDNTLFACGVVNKSWTGVDSLCVYDTSDFRKIFKLNLKQFFKGKSISPSKITFSANNMLIVGVHIEDTMTSELLIINPYTSEIKCVHLGDGVIHGLFCYEDTALIMLCNYPKYLKEDIKYYTLDASSSAPKLNCVANKKDVIGFGRNSIVFDRTYCKKAKRVFVDIRYAWFLPFLRKRNLYLMAVDSLKLTKVTAKGLKFKDFPFPLSFIGDFPAFYGEQNNGIASFLFKKKAQCSQKSVFSLLTGGKIGRFEIKNGKLVFIGTNGEEIIIFDLSGITATENINSIDLITFSPTAKYMCMCNEKIKLLIHTSNELIEKFNCK